ncbi:hypothetical protein V1478_012829 [Vespula squamosa]|uniref:Uncharacterized protein n=1 Tax=Vespula squamosa TaxID=30214 RepID=A0ABD2A938_VESSQ
MLLPTSDFGQDSKPGVGSMIGTYTIVTRKNTKSIGKYEDEDEDENEEEEAVRMTGRETISLVIKSTEFNYFSCVFARTSSRARWSACWVIVAFAHSRVHYRETEFSRYKLRVFYSEACVILMRGYRRRWYY